MTYPRSTSLLVAQLALELLFATFQSSELSATIGFESISNESIIPSTLEFLPSSHQHFPTAKKMFPQRKPRPSARLSNFYNTSYLSSIL
jgi:hypothetical protein